MADPVHDDEVLLVEVVSREHWPALTDGGSGMLGNTFENGGLDYLGREMHQMTFLPREVRSQWRDLGTWRAMDRGGRIRTVRPANIPRGHQLAAYAATLRLKEELLRQKIAAHLNPAQASLMTSTMDTAARRAWAQLAFGVPNGHHFAPAAGREQFGSGEAGLITLLEALAHYHQSGTHELSAASIFTLSEFETMVEVRIARARIVEAHLLDLYGLMSTARVRRGRHLLERRGR